ncbi:TRAP transporter permease [Inquilinus sp. CAU 1745]|uniref:TRAP transporter permease n=1 Tax=Inquilinus sp. CAU 1745 TaxID=3140369 RepID=UPI00325B79B2
MTRTDDDRTAELEALAATETGARHPGPFVAKLIAVTAFAWSVFQIWIASPLQFTFANILPVLNDTHTRAIHLAFGMFLAYMVFPALKRSPRDRVPATDWLLAIAGALAAAYISIFYRDLAQRPGLPTTMDLVSAGIGMVLLLEATRRALGPALTITALVFLSYVFFGNAAWVPNVIQWQGASFAKAMSHQWLTTEGVFGIALGVSANFVFLYVLFGALLDQAGAGNYFIKVAFSLLGHLRGGPAKAAVVASGLNGLVSGSSIANVVTGGSLTIPLMQRVGYPAAKAAAIEVASSVNGQIMPPVMGAAAFLMVEYVGIPYSEVIRHAFLPAIITYIALLYIVHLEALKLGMTGMPRPGADRPRLVRLMRMGIGIASLLIALGAIYYAVKFTQAIFGDTAFWGIMAGTLAVYVGLVFLSSRQPDLELDDPNAPLTELPQLVPTLLTGLHFLLPIYVLVWCLMVEFLSPGLSAYWATISLIFIVVTQRPLMAFFRGSRELAGAAMLGLDDMVQSFIGGARNMIGIALATATAGIVVGTVTLTGIGQVMTQFVEVMSGGHLLIMLALVAIISLILGMGLPTTANYIVVATLMAPVVVEIGAQEGLVVPLIAVHLFVFYFGLMADVTPPVGLASFAGAAIAREDPIKTGIQAFIYESRTVVLPFMFIFNTKLLLIGIEGPLDLVLTIATGLAAGLLVAAAMQGWFVTRSRWWESLALCMIAFTLFRPDFWLNQVEPEFATLPPTEVTEAAAEIPTNGVLRLAIRGPDYMTGRPRDLTVLVPLGEAGADGATRLEQAGIIPVVEGDQVRLEEPFPTSPLFEEFKDYDFYLEDRPVRIDSVQVRNDRMPAGVFWIPALLLLGLVAWLQYRRKAHSPEAAPVPASARI